MTHSASMDFGSIRGWLPRALADELHRAISPILVGAGERLLDALGSCADLCECTELVSIPAVTHVVLSRR
jgi:hypothetical protein